MIIVSVSTVQWSSRARLRRWRGHATFQGKTGEVFPFGTSIHGDRVGLRALEAGVVLTHSEHLLSLVSTSSSSTMREYVAYIVEKMRQDERVAALVQTCREKCGVTRQVH